MKKEELIIGKTYRVKSKQWFDENKNANGDVVQDGIKFGSWYSCGMSMVLLDFCDNLHGHHNDVELGIKGEDGWWKRNYIPPFALEEDPSDKRTASKEVLEAIEKLKAEKFIYGYDGGPGGGDGGPINTEKERIAPAFDNNEIEGVYLKVSHCKRIFSLARINELFMTGKTEQSFRASEYTTIRTELKLIEDKTNLPKNSSWRTMRD